MIGYKLGGRYELLEQIGGGGMALVYKARDLLLTRVVAVKVLRLQFTHDEEFIKRFQREAQAAASLCHPNIVSIYDVGRTDDAHYIVMEYVEGMNLNELILKRQALDPPQAVTIALQICDALAHAHANKIIHRDIKPHNILISRDDRVKVTDFGIARAVSSATITQTGSVIGSVHYFSPEHAKGVVTGEKSDLYSLGIVLYQMVTGQLPFFGESPVSVALKHLQEPLEQPRTVNANVPQSIENIINKALRKNPEERYSSAKTMMEDLSTCLDSQRIDEPAYHFSADDEDGQTKIIPAVREDTQPPSLVNSAKKPLKKWVMPTVLGSLALLLIGILIWGVLMLKKQVSNKDVLVPNVIGLTLEQAKEKLLRTGLSIHEPIEYQEVDDKEEVNKVLDQSKKEIKIKQGSEIVLTIGQAKEFSLMPSLVGQSFNEAVSQLKGMGVNSDLIYKVEKNSESQKNAVIEQFPAAHTQFNPAAEDIKITLTISLGEASFLMPNLVGKLEEEVKAIVKRFKLKLGEIYREPSYKPTGTVIKQYPHEKNEKVTSGTEISLWISNGFPKEALRRTVHVPVSPVEEGQESQIKIIYSDATGANIEKINKKITQKTSFPIDVIVAPGKSASIKVQRNGELLQIIPVLFETPEQKRQQNQQQGDFNNP